MSSRQLHALALRYEGESLHILDQTRLPHEEVWVNVQHPKDMHLAIQRLAVRGAPLIGVAAGLSLACYARWGASDPDIREWARRLREARPTAVNLMKAIDHIVDFQSTGRINVSELVARAESLFAADVELCRALATRGAELIDDWDGLLTICNTGGLATAGVGTALGAIRLAHEQGKKIHVYACETRPLLQGARLTMWELQKLKIPCTLITDSMAGSLMQQGRVQKVLVGTDRVAANGDFANKVGTYTLAVLARHHSIPFYAFAPSTSLDPSCSSGSEIEIELRNSEEVLRDWSPQNIEVWNPAFDVTPRSLISEVVTEGGFLATAPT